MKDTPVLTAAKVTQARWENMKVKNYTPTRKKKGQDCECLVKRRLAMLGVPLFKVKET